MEKDTIQIKIVFNDSEAVVTMRSRRINGAEEKLARMISSYIMVKRGLRTSVRIEKMV